MYINMDIRFEKQKTIYLKVNDLYINHNYTISEACEKVGICKQTYYAIKKKIISSPQTLSPQTSLIKNNKQIGGYCDKKKSDILNIFNAIDKEYNKTIAAK